MSSPIDYADAYEKAAEDLGAIMLVSAGDHDAIIRRMRALAGSLPVEVRDQILCDVDSFVLRANEYAYAERMNDAPAY